MKGSLVDSNIILDLFLNDAVWAAWSESILAEHGSRGSLYINPVIYAEVSIGFRQIEDLESAIQRAGFKMLEIPKEALFLAGKAFLKYRKKGGAKKSPLPDFFIGAQAAVLYIKLITRDSSRYSSYFPTVELVCPDS
jgi:predicted nucleic acid-binding protein